MVTKVRATVCAGSGRAALSARHTLDLNRNRRASGERTVYDDDAAIYADVASSSFDGLGHYRAEATSRSFAAGNSRTVTTSFDTGS